MSYEARDRKSFFIHGGWPPMGDHDSRRLASHGWPWLMDPRRMASPWVTMTHRITEDGLPMGNHDSRTHGGWTSMGDHDSRTHGSWPPHGWPWLTDSRRPASHGWPWLTVAGLPWVTKTDGGWPPMGDHDSRTQTPKNDKFSKLSINGLKLLIFVRPIKCDLHQPQHLTHLLLYWSVSHCHHQSGNYLVQCTKGNQ